MKNLLVSFLACGLVLIFVHSAGFVEAIKVKKVVKDAAKLSKKYGYLLASRKKKLYAVPFPMPLPVFIRRQQIYTQIPIIPRYVQHPQPYGAPVHSAESAYEPMSSQPSYVEVAAESVPNQRTKSSSSSTSSSSSPSSSSTYQDATSSTSGSGKYLSQLASIIGQSVPVFGSSAASTNRDLMNKLLSGQAKILPPTSLISAIKSPSAALAKYQKLQKGSDSAKEPDQESYYETSAQSGSDTSTETTRSPSQSTASSASPDGTRTSASEMHRTRQRIRASQGVLIASASDQRRAPIPLVYSNPMMSIATAAMAARQAPALMGRIPVNQLAAANQYLSLLDPNQMGYLEQLEPQPSELSEQVAANQNQQANDDDGQQQLEQRRQLLKMALLRERQEAERLLEARMVLARAKQIGQQTKTPSQQQLMAQLINYYKQNQMAQQLRQIHYLQLVRQQQLAQNSID